MAFAVLEVSTLFQLVTQLELLLIHWGASDLCVPSSTRELSPRRISLPQLPQRICVHTHTRPHT